MVGNCFRGNKGLRLLVVASFLLVESAVASECNALCQKKLVDGYFERLSQVFRKSSNKADIEGLFNWLHPAATYEHLKYEAKFSNADWKEAFLGNLERGAYANNENQHIRVEEYIHGSGYVAVSYSYGITSDKGKWSPKGDQNLLAMVQIKDGKVFSVKEYW